MSELVQDVFIVFAELDHAVFTIPVSGTLAGLSVAAGSFLTSFAPPDAEARRKVKRARDGFLRAFLWLMTALLLEVAAAFAVTSYESVTNRRFDDILNGGLNATGADLTVQIVDSTAQAIPFLVGVMLLLQHRRFLFLLG